jgi:hypothetical protein
VLVVEELVVVVKESVLESALVALESAKESVLESE